MKPAVLSAVFLFGVAGAQDIPEMEYEGSYDSVRLHAELDFSAILRTWKIKGVLVCTVSGEPRTCLWVENAYPCGIFEVVRQPLRSHLKEWEGVSEVIKSFDLPLQSSHGGDLQFADVRVWSFVPQLLQDLDIPIAAPPASMLELKYVSELDFLAWRSDWMDLLMQPEAGLPSCARAPDPRRCAGVWGAYRPRSGFAARSNEVMASYLQSLRGGRVGSSPAGRIVLSPYPYEPRTGHHIQMLSPSRRTTVSIGSLRVGEIERNALSKGGAYLFAHFGIFETCRGCLPVRLTGERVPE